MLLRSRKNLPLVAVLGLALLASPPSYALLGATVAGSGAVVTTPGGLIASEVSVSLVSQQIAAMQSSVSLQLQRAGLAITSQVAALQSMMQSEFKNQNTNAHTATSALIEAPSAIRHTINTAPAQQPQNLCDAPTLGAGIQVGSQTNRILTQKIAAASMVHDTHFTRSLDTSVAIMKAPAAVFGVSPIFNTNGSLSPAQMSVGAQWINADTAPNPLPALPTQKNPSASYVRYNAALRVNAARLSLPQNTLAMVEDMHSASLKVGNWTTDTWSAMTGVNGGGVPPGVINNKISDTALTRLQVAARYANPGWYAALATKNTNGVLRDIALMDSVRMHMQFVQLRLTERIAGLLSQMAAQQANAAAREMIGHAKTGNGS